MIETMIDVKYKVGDVVRCLCSSACGWYPGDSSCHPDKKFAITYIEADGNDVLLHWKGTTGEEASEFACFCPAECVELVPTAIVVGNELRLETS